VKKLLSNDDGSGNKVNSESKEDASATFILEPIIAYLDDPDCNYPAENEGEWILNKNIVFDYSLCLGDVFKSVDISLLHMPLPVSEMICMHIEDNEGSIFIAPLSKRDESLIIPGRGQAWATTSRESDDNLEPP